jgi:Calpain family cysteine protease
MTSGSLPKPEIEKLGFVKGHAYAVLKTYEDPDLVNKKTKKQVKLIKIRNPWGEKEWK